MAGAAPPVAGPWAKMLYLIRRLPETSREELVAHWFGGHMPSVIADQHRRIEAGAPAAHRYLVTLYDPGPDGRHAWDGLAQLWWDNPQPGPAEAHGVTPLDTFQQKAEPYMPWATREYVVVDGGDRLRDDPLTLNEPYPSTRSGFYKATYLVRTRRDTDHDAFFRHWLDVHRPNALSVMAQTGGFRYVVTHSLDPVSEPYAGMAELYFDTRQAWLDFSAAIQPDGMERWVEPRATLVLGAVTEMIGIP